MDKEIFKNAKFGDRFRTRDGELAIYNRHCIRHILLTKLGMIECEDDGTFKGIVERHDSDVVGKYDKNQ